MKNLNAIEKNNINISYASTNVNLKLENTDTLNNEDVEEDPDPSQVCHRIHFKVKK
jgi:hypothetical protein